MDYRVSSSYMIQANTNYFVPSYVPPTISKMDALLLVVDAEYVSTTNKLGAKKNKTVQKTSQKYVNDLRCYNKKLLTQLMLMPNSSLLDIKSLDDNFNNLILAEEIIKLHNAYLRKVIRELEISNKKNKK